VDQLLAHSNGRAAYVRPFFRVTAVVADNNERGVAQGENAAKIIASIIITGISLMFGYGLFHWIIFE
jgi:hypothetical protein